MKAFNIQPEVWSRLTRIKSNDKVGTSYLFTGIGLDREKSGWRLNSQS